MFWGCISGRYGKGEGLFWEKEWKTINQFSYSERIIPRVAQYIAEHQGLIFQQDNAPGHSSQHTRGIIAQFGILTIEWPALDRKSVV